jgi:hypothetical protein
MTESVTSAQLPDRDTLDAVVLYDLALTLITKTDMYPDRVVERVLVWLREMPGLDEHDRKLVNALADLLAMTRRD